MTEPVGTRRGRGGVRTTEVVYRLYETVDELSTVIENARSVPMSGSCMVPRDHVLDLLDDLRESLPEDVQAAGSIVEQRTEILQAAQAEAELLARRTRAEADQLVARAQREAERLVEEGRRRREVLIADGQAEHDRLVTETEVYQRALAQADELGAQSQADAARVRAEVDEYVDTRLADFGGNLERMLRSVDAARSALRD